MDHAITAQVFKVQKAVMSQVAGGPHYVQVQVFKVQKDVVSEGIWVLVAQVNNGAGVLERCSESGLVGTGMAGHRWATL